MSTVSLPQLATPQHEERAQQAAQAIRRFWNRDPEVAVILGTGLGGFSEAIKQECVLQYEELPYFPSTTAIGHQGRMVCGLLHDTPIIVLQGRTHVYEGADPASILFAVEVLQALKVKTLLVSCAAGGLSSNYQAGELMVINDHLNFMFTQCYFASAHAPLSNKTPLYDPEHIRQLIQLAREQNIPLHCGTYMAVQGPNYETRAELRFFKKLADAIGMSTIPEVQRAHQLGMRVCGLATITNVCNPDQQVTADGHEVVNVATQAEPLFRKLVSEFVRRFGEVRVRR